MSNWLRDFISSLQSVELTPEEGDIIITHVKQRVRRRSSGAFRMAGYINDVPIFTWEPLDNKSPE